MSEKRYVLNEIEPRSDKHLSKEKERPKRSKIVKGNVSVKKDSPLKSLFKIFFTDNPAEVIRRVFIEVVVPDIQNGLSNAAKGGIDALIYGDNFNPRKSEYNEYVSYRDSRKSRRAATAHVKTREDEHPKLSMIHFNDKADAEAVLNQLKAEVHDYGEVAVAVVYEYCDFHPYSTDNDYGWTDLSDAEIRRTPNGKWIIRYPRPERI